MRGQDRIEKEQGIPFPNDHYSPEEYGQYPQNWDVVQDDRGLTYVANNDGVLQYDGERWRTISTDTEAFVRSLAADSLVYVGGTGDFGVLRPDSTGTLRYESLSTRLPAGEQAFEDVWATHTTDEGVYYQANQRLFRWNGAEVRSWESESGFHTSFVVRGHLFVRDFERGLLEMRGDSLRRTPVSEAFSETPIYAMAPYPEDRILVGTRSRGLLLYDGETLEPFAPSIADYLRERGLYHGCVLPDGRYALATLGGGVVIVDRSGEVDRILDSDELPDVVVNHLYPGEDGTLWMALNNNGVYRANVGNAVTLYDERTGLNGLVEDIDRYEGRIWTSTGAGLHYLRRRGGTEGPALEWGFERETGVPLSKELLPMEEGALLATQEGIYHHREAENWERTVAEPTFDLQEARAPRTVYAGQRGGVMRLRREGGDWTGTRIQGAPSEVRSTEVESPRTLWVGDRQGRLFRIRLSADRSRVLRKEQVQAESGKPRGLRFVRVIRGRTFIVTRKGVFRVWEGGGERRLERADAFLPDTSRVSGPVRTLTEGPDGHLWLVQGDHVYRGQAEGDGEYQWTEIEALHFPKPEVVRLHVEPDGVVWVGSGKRLFRYDSNASTAPVRPSTSVPTLVRRVSPVGREETLYGGAPLREDTALSVPYGANNLRIDVAAPFYRTTGTKQYQFRLDGRDRDWTEWQDDPWTTYADLWEGTYRLQVRARTATGTVSQPATLTLRVQPPWYRTGWAYAAYLAVVGLLGLAGYRLYRLRRVRRQAEERAQELRRERLAKKRLEEANEQLREANRLKEEFLSNISHELRTPLTNILGFTDVLREGATSQQEEHLDIIDRNGRRLLDTLNALLDLATLRSGDADPNIEPTEIRRQVHEAVEEVRPRAESEGLAVRVEVPDAPVYAPVDERHLNQVLRNLLENAVKFTPEGHVAVAVACRDDHVAIRVSDTGIGIDDEFLPHLFDDFKQESRGMSRSYEGSGLGLAIAQRLVDLMDGDIDVESTKGEGSTFTVRLSRADQPEEERRMGIGGGDASPGRNGQS